MGRIIAAGFVVALCGLVTACYSPPHPECGFVCGTTGQCPTDYTCSAVDNICHLNGSSPTMICSIDAFVGSEPPPPEGAGFRVVSTTPASGTVQISRTADILVQFDRSANGATLTTTTFAVSHAGLPVVGVVSYIDFNTTAHFTPSPTMPPGALIFVQLASTVESASGLPLTPYAFSFTTLDDVPPTVSTSAPLDMATNVPVTTTIAVTFSEQVTNLNGTTFAVTQGATTITGTLTSPDSVTWTMTPDVNLPATSLITVSLGAGIVDTAGNPLAPVQLTFTTQ